MAEDQPEAIEINAAAPRPAPVPVAAPAEPEDAAADTLAASNRPDPTPIVMELGGMLWDCIAEIPAGRMADIIEQQLEVNEASQSDDPMRQARVVGLMLGLFEHFVVDAQLPALSDALRDKTNPVSLREAVKAAESTLQIYMRGESSGKR